MDMTTLGHGLHEIVLAERKFMPADVYEVGSMLSYDERLLLHHAARTGVPGAVVDLGAFLGGSTLALASGAEHRDAKVHSFDRFVLDAEWEKEWIPEGFDARPGDSTLTIYEHNIRRVRDRVMIHVGDVCEAQWNDPIGVLFIDIAKSWTTADTVWQKFFPSLQPGALVIQQDLVHWGHPWCAVIMEHLAEHFEYAGWTWYSSSVWRCIEPPRQIPPVMLEAFTGDEILELIDRSADRVKGPASGSIRLSGAYALASQGRFDAARKRVDEIRAAYTNEQLPFIEDGLAALDTIIARMEADR